MNLKLAYRVRLNVELECLVDERNGGLRFAPLISVAEVDDHVDGVEDEFYQTSARATLQQFISDLTSLEDAIVLTWREGLFAASDENTRAAHIRVLCRDYGMNLRQRLKTERGPKIRNLSAFEAIGEEHAQRLVVEYVSAREALRREGKRITKRAIGKRIYPRDSNAGQTLTRNLAKFHLSYEYIEACIECGREILNERIDAMMRARKSEQRKRE